MLPGAMVEQVRRFNRTVTQRVGALDDHYLARGRPLAEARVLWEIGAEGCEVRALRARLGLDSGHLSRLLRALEADGLVAVEAGERDRRVRVARLTRAGRAERAEVDRRAAQLAASLLDPLDPPERERLVRAMRDVERLLTAATVEIRALDREHPDARQCLRAYAAELGRRSDRPFDLDAVPVDEMLVAYAGSEPVGCGALKRHPGEDATDIKRMWVAAATRGLGLGRRLLEALEARVTTPVVRLETNAALVEAIALYRSAGYEEVAPFNDEPYAHHWFAKRLRPRPVP